MITTRHKIKVFISSACGNDQVWKEKYNIARAGLKALIESTQLAEVYLFEEEGASTLSAGQHYVSALIDCDVCIFLIDNADGVPYGVQVEIDTANKHKIKSLYYFCDKSSKDETPLQKSLMGAEFSKSTVVHSFEELIRIGAQGLLDDLVLIYKNYCKGRISTFSEENEGSYQRLLSESYFQTGLVVSRDVVTHIDKTKQYFGNFVFGSPLEVHKTNTIDDWCCRFLPVMFEQRAIEEFNLNLFLKELSKYQAKEYHVVVKKRWEAIQCYFCGDLEGCNSLLSEALELAKGNGMPDWIINDILIDLRNQTNLVGECNNYYFLNNNTAQIELDKSSNPIYYPLLDRVESELYKKIIEETLKQKVKSPYTVTLGDNIDHYFNFIANICVMAVFNGSLTHLLILYKRLELLSFHLCEKYSDWQFRRNLLKMAIINLNSKDIDGIINSYEDILCKMNTIDAKEIIDFSKNRKIAHERLISTLEAFKAVGYFLSDEDFDSISKELIHEIKNWINDNNRNIAVGSHIFTALSKVQLRLQQDELSLIYCECFENKLRRWYDDIFKLIGASSNLNNLSHENARRLIGNLVTVVEHDTTNLVTSYLEQALCRIRNIYRDFTEELDSSIKRNLLDFYENSYRLETSEGDTRNTPFFIRKYVEEIQMRNNTQGANGRYYGYSGRPHLTIISLFKYDQREYDDELLDSIFVAASNTLLAEKQMIGEKCEAIELLIFLSKRYPKVVMRNEDAIHSIKRNKAIVETGHNDILSNLSELSLKFSSLLLYDCFGEVVWPSMIEILHYFDDDIPALNQSSRAIVNYLEANVKLKLSNEIEAVLLQASLKWCNSKNLNVRHHAVRILFELLRNQKNSRIICNQLVKSIDSDNVYIKTLILRQIYRVKPIDPATYGYVMQKASIDTNYVVRKVYSEIISEIID